jgi:DNA invertase Pin-like site-specific DNA recombinase
MSVRPSTDEGLDQAFNSLDAQREACEAFITSQRHEGWQLLKENYDDGGYSGGSMDRPGLRTLLTNVSNGLVDVIVVYKIDRLTRSLADFAKMVDVFDAKGVSFVSVTQQFNTTTSMGRLTLNVLLSFAQFEREVTAERIRDKIAASRRKGLWMGGAPPLGYDVKGKKLVVNEAEAQVVRRLFEAYLRQGSTKALAAWTESEGITTKLRHAADGSIRAGGKPFSRGNLHALLSYRAYIGEVTHKGSAYPGEQAPIVPLPLWHEVQMRLKAASSSVRPRTCSGETSLLTGLLFDETGDRLTPSHTTKQGRRYRYYLSRRLVEGNANDQTGWRLPAREIEAAVLQFLGQLLRSSDQLIAILESHSPPAAYLGQSLTMAQALADRLQHACLQERRDLIVSLLRRISLSNGSLIFKLDRGNLMQALGSQVSRSMSTEDSVEDADIVAPFRRRRRGVETRLVLGLTPQSEGRDPILSTTIARAHAWFRQLTSTPHASVDGLSRQHGIPPSEISRLLPLAFLAPDIVDSILAGQQPPNLTTKALTRSSMLPISWEQQRKTLGFQTEVPKSE